MATSSKIQLTTENTGVFNFKAQTPETAAKLSELLQENHEKHHIFFNDSGYHNHLVHGLLTLYGLGAPTEAIVKHYNDNSSYQNKLSTAKEHITTEMKSPEQYKKYLGKGQHYPDFLVFFQNEITEKGWETVLNEFLFSGSELAEDLLGRLFVGLFHPFIHLGFGVEFKQPAIIAEALAATAVHDNWMSSYLLTTEHESSAVGSKNIPDLIEEIRTDSKLLNAAHWEDVNKIRDGVLKRAPTEMIKYAKQWAVSDSNLEQKTAEMINSAIYFTAAAQRPQKQVKFDFYYMHGVTSSIFIPTFNAQPWLSTSSKIRLLKFKVYTDLALYASRHSPVLLVDEVANYVPTKDEGWSNVWPRLFNLEDDGHSVKLARSVAFGEQLMRDGGYDKEEWAKIKGGMWEKIGNMIVDSVEDSGTTPRWVRSAGFDEAWEEFGDRSKGGKL